MLQKKPFYIVFLSTVIALGFVLPFKVFSQITNAKLLYSSINQVGLLTGNRGEAFSVQTINGIKKARSFAGLGVGLDFYGMRSFPLFFDFRRDLSLKKNTPFVYGDAGVNFPSPNYIEKEQARFPSFSPAWFYDFGLGIKLSGKNNRALIVSAGYSLKQIKYKALSYTIAPVPQMQTENYDRYNFLYRRLILKIGFQL